MRSLIIFTLSLLVVGVHAQQLVWTAVAQQDSNQVNGVAFSVDGSQVASGTNCHSATMKLYNSSNGTIDWSHVVAANLQCLMGIGFSPDGKYMGIMEEAGNILIYDYTKNPPDSVNTISIGTSYAFSIAFAPNNSKVAVGGSNGKLKSYWLSNGSADLDINAHGTYVTANTYSHDNKFIATGGNDKRVKIWDTLGVNKFNCIGHTGWVTAVKYSMDNSKLFSSARDKTIRIWNAADGTIIDTITTAANWVNQIDVSPDGKYVAAALNNGNIEIFDANTYASVMHFPQDHSTQAICIAWSPDSKKLVTGTANGLVTLYDVSTVGVEELSRPRVQVSPNPFDKHIDIANAAEFDSYTLMDMTGRVVAQGMINVSQGIFRVYAPNDLKSGAYVLTVVAKSGGIATTKVVR